MRLDEQGTPHQYIMNKTGWFTNAWDINRADHETNPERIAWVGTPEEQDLLQKCLG